MFCIFLPVILTCATSTGVGRCRASLVERLLVKNTKKTYRFQMRWCEWRLSSMWCFCRAVLKDFVLSMSLMTVGIEFQACAPLYETDLSMSEVECEIDLRFLAFFDLVLCLWFASRLLNISLACSELFPFAALWKNTPRCTFLLASMSIQPSFSRAVVALSCRFIPRRLLAA